MSMFTAPYLSELTTHLGTTAIDDSVDTLHCFLTAFLFAVSALLISAKMYAGTPIECWVPQTYSGEWGEFSEGYCFLKDTYWYPSQGDLNEITEDHKEQYRLNYYQWSSIFLTGAAMLFMFPKFVWKYAQNYTYTPLPYFCETTSEIKQKTTEQRKDKISEMATRMRDRIRYAHVSRLLGKMHLINVYIFVKVLYLVIALGQFVALAFFIGQRNDIFWGWTLFMNLANNITWETTGLFPRVTFCDFEIRELAGNNREETIQCLIGLNEFNEKIFLFLWFWILFVIVVTVFGILLDVYLIHKNGVVYSLLHTIKNDEPAQKRHFKEFAEKFLGHDGKLIICFVKRQSDLVAEELVLQMYENFQTELMNARNLALSDVLANDLKENLKEDIV